MGIEYRECSELRLIIATFPVPHIPLNTDIPVVISISVINDSSIALNYLIENHSVQTIILKENFYCTFDLYSKFRQGGFTLVNGSYEMFNGNISSLFMYGRPLSPGEMCYILTYGRLLPDDVIISPECICPYNFTPIGTAICHNVITKETVVR